MYSVAKRFGNTETRLQDFPNEAAAKEFIQKQLRDDQNFKIAANYRLYEGVDLLREYTPADVVVDESGGSTGGGTGGSGSSGPAGGRFSPTPLNTAPRPAGVPHSWVRDDEGKDKK